MAKVIAGMLVENLYQEMEVWAPIYRLQEIGVEVKIIAPTTNLYKSKLDTLFREELISPVVVDQNIITSRKPSDIPYFCKAIVDTLEKKTK